MGDAAIENQNSPADIINIPQANRSVEEKAEIVPEKIVKDSPENSEYDSADSYSDNEHGEIRSRGTDQESQGSGSESEGSVILEREEGDGQESVPSRKVDDDEDKKNPQYIPKKGTFYEHDDRTADDIEKDEAAELEKDKDGKKKVWQDKKEKWSHDRFNDTEQAPKSKSELIAIYGYDIRNEEGPPKARRRRRYGRGPNKYTRNWEDEDAYMKVQKRIVPKTKNERPRRRTEEEFPPLGGSQSRSLDSRNSTNSNEMENNDRHSSEKIVENNGNINTNNQTTSTIEYSSSNSNIMQESSSNKISQRVGSGRVVKPKKEIKDSDYRGFTTKTRQVRNFKVEQKPMANKPQRKDDFIQSQNFTNKNNNVHELEKDLGKMNLQEANYSKTGKQHNNQRQGSVPPRLQSEQKGSKRYSSMRQRSLPESGTPPNYPNSFYPPDYNPVGGQSSQPPLIHNTGPIHTATTQVGAIPPTPMPPLAQQVPVTAAPMLPPQFPPPPFPQPPPPFLQPGVAPPQFLPSPQQPPLINYVQGQPGYPPNFQGFQQPFNPVVNTPPPELYQPQGGITYYSADQQIAQRPAPQKRPKAAIPIVAPPENENKTRIKKEDIDTNEILASDESPIEVQQ